MHLWKKKITFHFYLTKLKEKCQYPRHLLGQHIKVSNTQIGSKQNTLNLKLINKIEHLLTLSRGTAEGNSRASLLRLCSLKNNPARPQLCITLCKHICKIHLLQMTFILETTLVTSSHPESFSHIMILRKPQLFG